MQDQLKEQLEPKTIRDQKIMTYERTVIHQTDSFEIVSVVWNSNSISKNHSHGYSQCMVHVESGVFENTTDLGFTTEKKIYEAGQVFNTPLGAKHEMRCLSAYGKTLHVYTPKIVENVEPNTFKVSVSNELKSDLLLSKATDIESVKKILDQIVKQSITTDSPYFMNQLFSGVLPQMLMAEEVIAKTKTTLATREASPALSVIESEVIDSLGQIIGWPKGQRDGVSVPGGSAANFMALHCARQKMFPEIKKTGLTGQKFKIFVSCEAHYSFKKACMALGFGTESLISVDADIHGRMCSKSLEKNIIEQKNNGGIPLIICATAGTTVLGTFDPILELSEICKKYSLWLHVDAAWGGPALFSKKLSQQILGIEKANSVTFDAHKLFGASLTCSFFLTQHPNILLEANDVSGADYLFHENSETNNYEIDRGKLSWQCGRKADALSFWTIWKSAGTDGLGQFVDRLLDVRDETLNWIQTQPRLQLVADPVYLNLCLRVVPPANKDIKDWSRAVREILKEKNQAMVNYSTNEQGHFLRLILAHPFLQFKDVKQILEWALDAE